MKVLSCLVCALSIPAFAKRPAPLQHGAPMAFVLTSSVFSAGAEIPTQYTCEGQDRSPPLAWSNLPMGTESLVLIVDDPDSPPKGWVHWVLYNLPQTTASLAEGAKPLPQGALEGMNDFKRTGYGGPCPPSGRHRYFFKLYALDRRFPDLASPTQAEVLRAIEGHIRGRAELVGTYEKKRRR